MKLIISILNFYREDLTYSIVSQLKDEIENVNYDVDIVIGVNKLSDGVTFEYFSSQLTKIIESVDVALTIKNNELNIGFGKGHNINLLGRNCEYFLILNNDLIFHEKGWLSKLIDNCVDAVGLSNAPHNLLTDGAGDPDINSNNFDYIEASCLMIKGSCFNEVQGFDHSFLNAYCEDSDLSLRLKFLGYKLNWIKINHEHLRSSSAKKIDPFVLKRLISINQKFFQQRWRGYLSNKNNQGLVLELNSVGLGDIVNTIHAITNLKTIYGNTLYVIDNPFSWMFNTLGVRVLRRKEDSKLIKQLYSFDLFKNIEFRSHISIERQVYNILGSPFDLNDNYARAKQLANKEINKSVIIHVDYNRQESWQGRSADLTLFSNIAEYFIKRGYEVIVISENKPNQKLINMMPETVKFKYDLKMTEIFDLVSSCEYFAGVDSLIFNIAQFFYKKIILMMGPTSVASRVNRGVNYIVFQNEQLRCLGCYNDMSADRMNKCLFITPLCETVNLTKEQICMRLDSFATSNNLVMTELQPSFIVNNYNAVVNNYSGREALAVLVRAVKRRLKSVFYELLGKLNSKIFKIILIFLSIILFLAIFSIVIDSLV